MGAIGPAHQSRGRSLTSSRRLRSSDGEPCSLSSTCRSESAHSFVVSPSAQRRSIEVRPVSIRKRAPRSRGDGCIRQSLPFISGAPAGDGAGGERSSSVCGGGLGGVLGVWAKDAPLDTARATVVAMSGNFMGWPPVTDGQQTSVQKGLFLG